MTKQALNEPAARASNVASAALAANEAARPRLILGRDRMASGAAEGCDGHGPA